jgi:hypothetical protein
MAVYDLKINPISYSYFISLPKVTYGLEPDVELGCCLGSERNGVSVGGGYGRPGPPERGKDKQSVPNKGRDNMGEDEENHSSRM